MITHELSDDIHQGVTISTTRKISQLTTKNSNSDDPVQPMLQW
jgi:hypothetical protein